MMKQDSKLILFSVNLICQMSDACGFRPWQVLDNFKFRSAVGALPRNNQLKSESMIMITDPIIVSIEISFLYLQCRQPKEKYLYLLMLKEREKDWMKSLNLRLILCAQRIFLRQAIFSLHDIFHTRSWKPTKTEA